MTKARILLPPGIGDIHWCMLRLRGLLSAMKLDGEKPLIFACSVNPRYDRSHDYIRSIPFVEWGGYHQFTHYTLREFDLAVNHRQVFVNWNGYDLFFCVNNQIEQGESMDSIFPEAGETDWDYPIDAKPVPIDRFPNKPFVEITFYRHGSHRDWWYQNEPEGIIRGLLEHTDFDYVLTGAEWDAADLRPLVALDPKRIHDEVGRTSIDELFMLKRRSAGFVGHPSGSGIMSVHFRAPTVMLWGQRGNWSEGMRTCWARPDMLAGQYRALDIRTEPREIAAQLLGAMRSASVAR